MFVIMQWPFLVELAETTVPYSDDLGNLVVLVSWFSLCTLRTGLESMA